MIKFFSAVLIVCLISGCSIEERERALKEKENQLTLKEQELLLKENTLSLKEQELAKREQLLDSIGRDTVVQADPRLAGRWTAKMTCVETTCPGSAVGDTKSGTWEFAYQDDHLIVKSYTGDKLERIYSGSYTGAGIHLTEVVAHSAAGPGTRIFVRLSFRDDNTMDGQREIIRENDCRILYTLQLNKQQ